MEQGLPVWNSRSLCHGTEFVIYHPATNGIYKHSKMRQKINHDVQAKERHFEKDDTVFVRNFNTSGEKWISGVLKKSKDHGA